METSVAPQVTAALEDTQASLAAALARIEVFRLREKQLIADIAQLRHKVYELTKDCSGKNEEPSTDGNSAPETPVARIDPDWSSVSSQPVYVTNISGKDVPVNILSGLKKVPGSLVVTPEFIDFVEIKARIRQEDFVGITSVKTKNFEGPLHDVTPPLTGVWQVIWNKGGINQRLSFEASHSTREILHRRMERWLGEDTSDASEALLHGTSGASTTNNDSNASSHSPSTRSLRPPTTYNLTASSSSTSSSTMTCCFPWGRPPATIERYHADADASSSSNPNIVLNPGDKSHSAAAALSGKEGPTLLNVASTEAREDECSLDLVPPRVMAPTSGPLTLDGSASQLLRPEHLAALGPQIPPLQRMRTWTCTYSTFRHGTSLQTLYRKVQVHQPSVLVVRDFGGYLFGAYTAEGWRVAPRFFGSGETFVFQLEPSRVAYPWQSRSRVKNDYFMYATLECLAVGGQGRFAIWLDNELARGSSGACGTFGSPCLAAGEEFSVQGLEVWQPLPH